MKFEYTLEQDGCYLYLGITEQDCFLAGKGTSRRSWSCCNGVEMVSMERPSIVLHEDLVTRIFLRGSSKEGGIQRAVAIFSSPKLCADGLLRIWQSLEYFKDNYEEPIKDDTEKADTAQLRPPCAS